MTTISRPIVAGIGFASTARAAEIIGLVEACLAESGAQSTQLVALVTHIRKRGNPVLAAVAAHFGIPIRLLSDAELGASVAEAAAGAAGQLRLGKRKSNYATCAIADCRPGFTLAGLGQPSSLRAAIASSTVLTSSAGP